MKSQIMNVAKLILLTVFVACSQLVHAENIISQLKALEATTEGRLGIFALNTQNGEIIEYRANEIFPTGCTSKVMGVAAVLKKSMTEPALLDTKVNYAKKDLAQWSPVTKQYLHEGMTIQALCAASISFSDNTAMNLLLKPIGGVQGMNAFARSIEDQAFSQDHDWPREAYSGGIHNVKDASTPKAMVESLRKIMLGDVLAEPQKALLTTWLIETNTGAARIRAGVPDGWKVGNKTGTGGVYGSTNDLAIIWPAKHEPLLLGVYYTSDNQHAVKREDIVASATKLVMAAFMQNDKKLES